ncbi:MAG: hypothetical protein V4444_10795 [Pseudomonadota bacterium]
MSSSSYANGEPVPTGPATIAEPDGVGAWYHARRTNTIGGPG